MGNVSRKTFLMWIAALSTFVSATCSSFLLFVEENIDLKTANRILSIARSISVMSLFSNEYVRYDKA
jgi:hypothetical protein